MVFLLPLVSTSMSIVEHAGLSYGELWLRYFELGGIRDRRDMEAILCGMLVPSDYDHDIIALALNERLVELGRGTIPFLTPRSRRDHRN